MSAILKSLLATAVVISVSTSFAGPVGKGGKPAEVREVKALERTFTDLGISGAKVDGIAALAQAKPEIRSYIDSTTKQLKTAAAQESIKANKANFETLIKNIDAASAQAAEVIAAGGAASPTAGKILEAIEALPGVLAEVAVGGPKADVQKANDIAAILANVTNNVMKNEGNPRDIETGILTGTAEKPANATDVIILINQKLGSTKDGKKITIDDLIKRCLEMMRKGKAS